MQQGKIKRMVEGHFGYFSFLGGFLELKRALYNATCFNIPVHLSLFLSDPFISDCPTCTPNYIFQNNYRCGTLTKKISKFNVTRSCTCLSNCLIIKLICQNQNWVILNDALDKCKRKYVIIESVYLLLFANNNYKNI